MALIRIIDAGMIMSRIDANWFKFAIGSLTILAVIANAWLSRAARRHQSRDRQDDRADRRVPRRCTNGIPACMP